MLNIRDGLFETNSSSTSEFIETTVMRVQEKVVISLDFLDSVAEEQEDLLSELITSWLKNSYAKESKVVKITRDSSNTTLELTIEGKFKAAVDIWEKSFFSKYERSYQFVGDSCTVLKSDGEEDKLLDSLLEYAQTNTSWPIPIIGFKVLDEELDTKYLL